MLVAIFTLVGLAIGIVIPVVFFKKDPTKEAKLDAALIAAKTVIDAVVPKLSDDGKIDAVEAGELTTVVYNAVKDAVNAS